MTFRAKPVANRPHRSSRDGESRRNLYLNIGFGITVVAAVLILVGVAGISWYSDHLAAAATVDGQTITRDDFKVRAAIEGWRIEQQVSRINTALAAGRLTSAEANQRIQSLQSQAQGNQLAPIVIERMIDARIQAKLATEAGVSPTPEQIEAKITEEKTTPEERHAWIIAVTPEVDEGKDEPTAAQKEAAKKIADQALTDLTGGKAWEDVAKAVSTDSSSSTGGDLGWIDRDAAEDEAYIEAIFAAEPNTPTAVIESETGTYMIGRVTEVATAAVDQAWEQKLIDAGIDVAAYRSVVQSEVVRDLLEEKVIADASKSGPQRKVLEIAIQAPQTPPSDEAVKVRHILYSPNDDPAAAQNLPADDPAWTEAQLAALKAHDELVKDPTKFDERAREESDEASAQGDTGTGGKLPYVDNDGQFVSEFADAVLGKPELKAGDILPPVKTDFGWHVIQVMYRPPDIDQMTKIRDEIAAGGDFEKLAREYSDGNEAGKGGDRGWIAQGMLDARQTRAIFDAQVGGLSEIVEIENGGTFLYKVVEERTAAPDEDQLVIIESRGFQNWYGEKKDAVPITRDLLVEAGLG
ncbi:MAG TPA: peptidylprolyl isomerase [Candidatus Limnocylindrales bacterium]|nr:peptidylprolyl isomerase [Candidatus Limnocylindrales bacterium]